MQVRRKKANSVKKDGSFLLVLGQGLRQLIRLRGKTPFKQTPAQKKAKCQQVGEAPSFTACGEKHSVQEGGGKAVGSLGWLAQGQGNSEAPGAPLRAATNLASGPFSARRCVKMEGRREDEKQGGKDEASRIKG